jgi:hypothetical protein
MFLLGNYKRMLKHKQPDMMNKAVFGKELKLNKGITVLIERDHGDENHTAQLAIGVVYNPEYRMEIINQPVRP